MTAVTRDQLLAVARRAGWPQVRAGEGWAVDEPSWRFIVSGASPHELARLANELRYLEPARQTRDVGELSDGDEYDWPEASTSEPTATCREPTLEQLRAVADAIEKFKGEGRWSALGRRVLPPFVVGWDVPGHRGEANAMTVFCRDGSIAVCLRTDQPAPELHQTMLHELQHVFDHELINGLPSSIIEARARLTAELLGRV